MLEGARPPGKVLWDGGLLELPSSWLSDSCIQWPPEPTFPIFSQSRLENAPHIPQLLVTSFFILPWAGRTGWLLSRPVLSQPCKHVSGNHNVRPSLPEIRHCVPVGNLTG